MRAQISQHAHRITCWSPLWGAGPLSGALLGDGASWSAPLPCKTTPTCLGTVRHLYRRPCIWGSGGVRSRRRPGAAGQVETQAAGRSSCSAVSSCPVVPSGRSVLGWVFSASWNSVAIGDLFRVFFREAILMMELPRRHAASLKRAAGSHPIRVQSMGGGRGRDRAQMTYSSSGLLSGSVWQMRRLWLAAHQTPPACASIP